MNKIVREHYPVANLPEDLRKEFEGAEMVTLQIQEESDLAETHDFWSFPIEQIKPLTPQQFEAALQGIRSSGLPNVSPEEAVRRIRELRDEWDSE